MHDKRQMDEFYNEQQTLEKCFLLFRSGRDGAFRTRSSPDRAKKRWKLLADALLANGRNYNNNNNNNNDNKNGNSTTIKKNLQTLGLLQFENEKYDQETFFCRAYFRGGDGEKNFFCSTLKVNLQIFTNSTGLNDLIGFDNTGNVRIWPSEEIMAYYCLKHKNFFRNKSICELGAGMTGLASIFLAQTGLPTKILVTDGNEKSAENLKRVVKINTKSQFDNKTCLSCIIDSRRLRWGNVDEFTEFQHSFDIILAADCFFFKNADELLLKCVDYLLKPNGTGIFFAPLRNGTFQRFVEAVSRSKSFKIVRIVDDYCPEIANLKQDLMTNADDNYEKFDSIFPFFLQIEKIGVENMLAPPCGILDGDNNTPSFKFPR